MRRISFAQLLSSSLLLAVLLPWAVSSWAARRPRYGGTLHIDLQGRVASLDPAQQPASIADRIAQERLLGLVADCLVRLGQSGKPEPALGVSWQHNEKFTHWELHLRPDVKFQDGTPLTAETAAISLQAVNPGWRVSATNDSIIVELGASSPELLYTIAEPRNSIVLREPSGATTGTGPFRLTTWDAKNHAVFAANDDYWGGRPFVDGIDVQMGSTVRERMIDLDLGKTDIADVAADRARIDTSRGVRIVASEPGELFAIVFLGSIAGTRDIRARQAISLAIDRTSLVNFALQEAGEPTGALLPQWCSGYEFLFSTNPDPAGARALASQISPTPALKLGYDSADAIERMAAERVAVNAQGAGIAVTVRPMDGSSEEITSTRPPEGARVDMKIVRLLMPSPAPGVALMDFAQNLAKLTDLDPLLAAPLSDPTDPGELYSRERAITATYEMIPLMYAPEVVGLSKRVRDWMPAPWGAWRLADVWLDGAAP